MATHQRAARDDMLIIRGVNVFPTQIEALVLRLAGLAPHYQLEVTRTGHLDELAVHVECMEATAADASARSRLKRELESSIKTLIGVSARVLSG